MGRNKIMTAQIAYRMRRAKRERKKTYEFLQEQNSKGSWFARLLSAAGSIK